MKDTEHMALRDCSEDGVAYTLTDGGTHSGQPPESWHRRAIIPNALTSILEFGLMREKKTGGETAARWMGKHTDALSNKNRKVLWTRATKRGVANITSDGSVSLMRAFSNTDVEAIIKRKNNH